MSVDDSATQLHGAGWSIGETAGTDGWLVTGTKGDETIIVTGGTHTEAWQWAAKLAQPSPNIVVDRGSALP